MKFLEVQGTLNPSPILINFDNVTSITTNSLEDDIVKKYNIYIRSTDGSICTLSFNTTVQRDNYYLYLVSALSAHKVLSRV